MTLSQKYTFCFFFLLVIPLLFIYRYLAPDGGFPGFSWDYGTHIAIINYLRGGEWFPEIHKTAASAHGVLKWLPMYHGLLGSHLAAIGLTNLGPPLPGTMLFLGDLGFACGLFFILHAENTNIEGRAIFCALLACLVFYVTSFSAISNDGFFSQALGAGVACMAFWRMRRGQYLWGGILFMFALVTYPDVGLWFSLPLASLLWRLKPRGVGLTILSAVLLLLFLIVLFVFVSRTLLPGSIALSMVPFVSFAVLFLADHKSIRANLPREYPFLKSYALIAGLLLVVTKLWLLDVPYYVMKLTFWSSIFIPYILLRIPFRWRNPVLCLLPLVFLQGYEVDLVKQSVAHFFKGQTSFTNRQSREMERLSWADECTQALIFPLDEEVQGRQDLKVLTIARNSYFMNMDLYEGKFRNDLLPHDLRTVIDFTGALASDQKKFYETRFHEVLERVYEQSGSCIYVSPKAAALADTQKFQAEPAGAWMKVSRREVHP